MMRPQQQGFSSKVRLGLRRAKTPKEQLQDAALQNTHTASRVDSMGQVLLAGGAAVGLGALCYYGLGMSSEIGAIEKAAIWPQYVRDRIHSTYLYFAGSVGLTALSAVAISRTPVLMGIMMSNSWLAIGATFAALIGAGVLVRSVSYEHSPVAKHLSWALYAGVFGAVVAPLTLLGGPLMLRAVWCTAGVVGGLSTVAVCAPSERFLNMGGPLAVGLGLVLASTLGSMFLPPSTAVGAGLYSVSVYGGLLLFSLFLLYDTQKVIKRAETHPLYSAHKYDPINASLGIFIDTINIFMRLVMILSGAGSRRK